MPHKLVPHKLEPHCTAGIVVVTAFVVVIFSRSERLAVCFRLNSVTVIVSGAAVVAVPVTSVGCDLT